MNFRIRNMQSGYYLLAGGWGKSPGDTSVWQFPLTEKWPHRGAGSDGNEGFVWQFDKQGRIKNIDSGKYLLAGAWGDDPRDRSVHQFPATNMRNGMQGFQWDFTKADGRIKNRRSGMYLLAGAWGEDPRDRSVWQFPEHEKKKDKQGFQWALEPLGGCGTMHTVGRWTIVRGVDVAAGVETGVEYGWSKTDTFTEEKNWQATVGASISAGFSVEVTKGVATATMSSSVTISAEYSTGGSQSFSSSSSQQGLKTLKTKPTESGALWTWGFTAKDHCGSGILATKSYVVTPSSLEPPCCPPVLWADLKKPAGRCFDRKFCVCDSTYCDLLHGQKCRDNYASCPQWAQTYGCHGQHAAFMAKNCKNTCNQKC